MKSKLSKKQSLEEIEKFFQKDSWKSRELLKIKKIAMRQRIKLVSYKKLFCKKCFLPLKGRIRINHSYKTIICEKCGFINKRKM